MERSLVEREEQKSFEFAGTGAVDDGDDAAALVPPPPPAVPVAPELQCRYPNKPCPQPRVPKKRDGELHSYCEYHRYKAQLYQRKLEQKKRERRRLAEQKSEQGSDQDHDDGPHTPYYDPRMMSVDQQGASWGQTVATVAPVNLADAPDAAMLHAAQRVGYRPAMNQEAFEPYPHPVTLQADDIHALQSLFIEDTDQQFKVEGGNVLQARINAHGADMAMGTQVPQGYVVDLDGFAFTSEGSRQAYRYGNA
ncbi:hypothetical protein Poli38472_007768 [Pythium oligandrum]|uniref:Uncharacterized protein n=1 Tax=Pythium oligandrum TaxID=41045 RepID=A0A8K1CT04_PYTOL|nr:hypothetical protein Poli38472_007768 [Pythium oligandrum]|eukprot:TMW68096.1 hypothetical protein Poli38472_007768 [Pythium oligandrum]